MKILICLFSTFIAICNACHADPTKRSDNEKVQLANQWLLHSYSINDIPREQLRGLLITDDFTEIENILSQTDREFKKDVMYELKLLRAYESFASIAYKDDGGNLDHIDKWVSKTKSYIAYAAKGFYYAGKADKVRGDKYIGKTPESNLVVARSLWAESIASFNQSISMNDNLLPSYAGLMEVGMVSGNRVAAEDAINEALSHTPEAFYIRVNYIEFLQPKWGGTYEEASKFIDAAQIYGEKNPRIWTLRGLIPSMQGYQYMLDGKFAISISKYSEALKYGDKPAWIRAKAFGQYMISDYNGAIESMMKASKYMEEDEKSSLLRVVEILKTEEQNKSKEGHGRPADTLDENGAFYGPLSWRDFQ